MTKIIAFYLPQFHVIPENNAWWGEGFTEWVNTRKAKPLYNGHYQPREPYNDNYYDLLDHEARVWQAELAKKYDIGGFCYYHYWFNGKMLLEKPLEGILKDKNPDFPFCMCWANEPWTRAWDGGEKEVIMPQEYGNKDNWEKHFNYLIQFFKDDRYIKVDNKPLFVIYRTSNINNCEEMVSFWNDKCIENGFEGIYLVEEANTFQKEPCLKQSEAVIDFEPMLTVNTQLSTSGKVVRKVKQILRKNFKLKILDTYDYDTVWKNIINKKVSYGNKKVFLGGFVDWDNTARKNENATIIKGASPEKFEKYLTEQLKKADEVNSEFVFINAWNEWAEGTYLEPDKKYKYGYLEAVSNAVKSSKE